MGNTKRGKNEGSIRERKDGRFEVRVTSGIDFSTGKSKRISYYANTRAEATKILHSAEYDIHFNQHIDPTSITFLDWLRTWLETYMKQSLKQSTYVSELQRIYRKSYFQSFSDNKAERCNHTTSPGFL